MAGIILILLIVVLLIVIAMSKNKKKTSLVALGILVSYHLYVSYKCGPNKKDVAVMKPMAEAISNYIVKNGIPKSLEDIPDLPYELECGQSGKECYFYNKKYEVKFYKPSYGGYELRIFSEKTKTAYKNYFKMSENKKLILNTSDSGSYSLKTSGICSPMKQ